MPGSRRWQAVKAASFFPAREFRQRPRKLPQRQSSLSCNPADDAKRAQPSRPCRQNGNIQSDQRHATKIVSICRPIYQGGAAHGVPQYLCERLVGRPATIKQKMVGRVGDLLAWPEVSRGRLPRGGREDWASSAMPERHWQMVTCRHRCRCAGSIASVRPRRPASGDSEAQAPDHVGGESPGAGRLGANRGGKQTQSQCRRLAGATLLVEDAGERGWRLIAGLGEPTDLTSSV